MYFRCMAPKSEERLKKRLRTSYLSVVVAMTLVLFVLGIFGMLVLNAQAISRHVKENFTVLLLLELDTPELEMRQLQKSLGFEDFVLEATFVSKEEAARMLMDDLGEDFVDFLGYNPLSDAIQVRLMANYVTPEFIETLTGRFAANPEIAEVSFDADLVDLMNRNIRQIGGVVLGISGLLLLVGITLINSSIRLSLYARRFSIRTMQLVGATSRFIRRPFILKAAGMGTVSALVAIGLNAAILYSLQVNLPEFNWVADPLLLGSTALVLLGFGVVIASISAFFGVRRYLNLKTDDLYL